MFYLCDYVYKKYILEYFYHRNKNSLISHLIILLREREKSKEIFAKLFSKNVKCKVFGYSILDRKVINTSQIIRKLNAINTSVMR